MIYLDNAATSWPKPGKVTDVVAEIMKTGCANPGRSSHLLARRASQGVMRTRELVAGLFHISNPLDIAFTLNATFALNMAIQGILKKGDHVVTTALEHNSVLRPLWHLSQSGLIQYSVVGSDNPARALDPEAVISAIIPQTRLIVCTASSNVTGAILPFEKIAEAAWERKIPFLLDAAQGAGVLNIDTEALHVSLLAFPGHKGLLGPQGTGGLYVRPDVTLKPLIYGGTGSKSFETVHPDFMPDKLEGGTLNTPGILGLGAGVEWILHKGLETIRDKKKRLITHLYDRLKGHEDIELFSVPENNSGIIAFRLRGMDSSETANRLDSEYQIAVRSGFHCAPLAHRALGTMETGLVRVSPGYFNTLEEMEAAARAILKIAAKKGS